MAQPSYQPALRSIGGNQMTNKYMKIIATVLVLMLAASACGGTGATENPDELDGAQPTTDTAATTTTESEDTDNQESAEPEPGDEPQTLQDYLGGLSFGADPAESAAYFNQQEQRVQELVAACMANEGFEYISATQPINDTFFGGGDSGLEFADEFGFGISTTFGETDSPFVDEAWVDPNDAIVTELSDSERTAYYEALYGFDPQFEESGFASSDVAGTVPNEDEPSLEREETLGCRDEANEEVYAFEATTTLLQQLDIESLQAQVEADPRGAEIFMDWSDCMAQNGYNYETPEALYETVFQEFSDRLTEIVGSQGGFVDPFEGMSEEEVSEFFNSKSEAEIEDFFAQQEQQAQQNVDQEALTALQDEERGLAVSNAECSESMNEQLQDIYLEYEAIFVAENRAALEAFRAEREG